MNLKSNEQSPNSSRKTSTPILKSTRLLDQLREKICYLHCSLGAEKSKWGLSQNIIQIDDKRPPRDKGQAQVEAFFSLGWSAARLQPRHPTELSSVFPRHIGQEIALCQRIGRDVGLDPIRIDVVKSVDHQRQRQLDVGAALADVFHVAVAGLVKRVVDGIVHAVKRQRYEAETLTQFDVEGGGGFAPGAVDRPSSPARRQNCPAQFVH